MSNLVERLRTITEADAYALPWTTGELCRKAAARIEALEADLRRAHVAPEGGR
jgi:hypothetical protein